MASSVFLGSVYATMELRTDGWKQSIGQAKSDLDSLEKTTTSKMESIGNSMTSVGKKLSLGLTVPITAFGVASIKSGQEFDKTMRQIKSLGQLTEDQLNSLTDSAFEFAEAGIYSGQQIADAMMDAVKDGLDPANEAFKEQIKSALLLAAAAGSEVYSAQVLLSNAMSMYGIEASRAGEASNILGKILSATQLELDDLAATMTYAGPAAHALGVNLNDTALAIGIMGDQGIKGSVAGTTLRRALVNLANPTNAMADAIDEMGLEAFNAQGKFVGMRDLIGQLETKTADYTDEQRLGAFATIFGAQAMNGMNILVGEGVEGWDAMATKLNDATSLEQQLTDKQSGLNYELKSTANKFHEVRVKIAELLEGPLKPLLQAIRAVFDAFLNAPKSVQTAIVIFFGLLAVIGPLLIIFGALINSILAIQAVLVIFGTTMSAVLWPIFLVVAAIVALVAIGYLLYKHWDTIKAFMLNLWTVIVQKWNMAMETIKEKLGQFKQAVINVLQGIITFFLVTYPNALKTFVTQTIPNFFMNLITQFLFNIGYLMVYLWLLPGRVAEVLTDLLNRFITWGTDTWNWMLTNIPIYFDTFIQWVAALPSRAYAWLVELYNRFVQWGSNVWAWLSTEIPKQFNNFIAWISALPGRAGGGLSTLTEKIMEQVGAAWTAMVNEVKTWPDRMYQWGVSVAKAFVDGFSKIGSWIKDKVQAGMNQARSDLEGHSPPKEGPFRNIDKWGINVGMAWVEGFGQALASLSPAIASIPNLAVQGVGATQPVSKTINTTNAPSFHVHLGLYAGSAIEKREIAKELNDAYEDYRRSTGDSIDE
jgi:TP901 family phage tail tape measure protein